MQNPGPWSCSGRVFRTRAIKHKSVLDRSSNFLSRQLVDSRADILYTAEVYRVRKPPRIYTSHRAQPPALTAYSAVHSAAVSSKRARSLRYSAATSGRSAAT
eukprot:scaffold39432_cov67-Phaeocystis_antarctica.AAC.1